jgi:uncharacterized protein involved in exopolysaccharide biosynthesis
MSNWRFDAKKRKETFYAQTMELEVSHKLLMGFDVTVEPVVLMQPVRPKKALAIAVAGITVLFFSIFLAILLEWVEK